MRRLSCLLFLSLLFGAILTPGAVAQTQRHDTIFGVFYTGTMDDATYEQNRSTIFNGFIVIALGSGLAWWLLSSAAKSAKEERRRRDREERERREEATRSDTERRLRVEQQERERKEWRAKQDSYESELSMMCGASSQAFASIPRSLMTAEELLDVAEKDFSEEAFSPFWDAIERAVNNLGEADKSVQQIALSAQRYRKLVPLVVSSPPKFPVDVQAASRLVAANKTGARLKEIVRTAQRNFQFATIYEQRKTNQILVSGFNNLGDAIVGLGQQISRSIEDVCERVGEVNQSIRQMDESMRTSAAAEAEQHARAMEADEARYAEQTTRQNQENSARAQAAEKALDMLDNIQRGKRPYP